jgi:hypothetical protein
LLLLFVVLRLLLLLPSLLPAWPSPCRRQHVPVLR